MNDIVSESDIKQLVDCFYHKVNMDEILSPIFNDLRKVDWEKHLPTMYKFWGTLLIGTLNYNGAAFAPHAALPIGKEHFDRWLMLFHQTVDENFEGEVAQQAKDRANSIGSIFLHKLEALKKY